MAGHPKNVVFLTADAFGVMPPIAKLTPEQAMYHFLSGYTAKLAGTERGVTEPKAAFSACFGAPFLPLPPSVYADMLGAQAEGARRAGLAGEHRLDGRRVRHGHAHEAGLHPRHDRAALSGSWTMSRPTPDPVFGLHIPQSVPGVPDEVLIPARPGRTRRVRHPGREAGRHVPRELRKFEDGVSGRTNAGPANDPQGRGGLQRPAVSPAMAHPHAMKPITIRDPLWDTIRVDAGPPDHRQRRRSSGCAHQAARSRHLVYPGATHTRFDHAVGVYHLAAARCTCSASAAARLVDPLDCASFPSPRCSTTSGTTRSRTRSRSWSRPHPRASRRARRTLPAAADVVRARDRRARRAGARRAADPRRVGIRCRAWSAAASISTRSSTSSATRASAACRTARWTWTGCCTRSRCCRIPHGQARGRRAREGRRGAGVAAVREVPDVQERLLAPRRARRDGAVQAVVSDALQARADPRRRAGRRDRRPRSLPISPEMVACGTFWTRVRMPSM
jgi:hypothetical protein